MYSPCTPFVFLTCQCVSYRQHTAPPSYIHATHSYTMLYFLYCMLHVKQMSPTNRLLPHILLCTYHVSTITTTYILPTTYVCYPLPAAPLITFMLRATPYAQSQLRPLWWLRVPALISSIRFNPVGKRKALAKIKVSCLQLICVAIAKQTYYLASSPRKKKEGLTPLVSSPLDIYRFTF